jgi:hypothetical protein
VLFSSLSVSTMYQVKRGITMDKCDLQFFPFFFFFIVVCDLHTNADPQLAFSQNTNTWHSLNAIFFVSVAVTLTDRSPLRRFRYIYRFGHLCCSEGAKSPRFLWDLSQNPLDKRWKDCP